MFDNMTPYRWRRAVKIVPANIYTEASGGITLKNVARSSRDWSELYFHRRIDTFIEALDISLEFEPIMTKMK